MTMRSILAVMLVVAVALSACSRDPSPAGEQSKGDRRVLYWKSPMDPTFVAQAPGKDPMGMDLVPVYEGDQAEGPPGQVRIDAATVQTIGVKTATVEREPIARQIRTIGRIAYDETKIRRVAPKIAGWVEAQPVNFPGQVVEAGQPLLEIYSPELVSTQEEYLTALRYRKRLHGGILEDALTGAEGLVRAAETRLRYWEIDDAQIDALRRSGAITRTMTLRAPFRGIVVERHVPEGGYIAAGQTVYGISDLSTVWVYADLYEYEAPWVRPGQSATMTLAYDPGREFQGDVTYVYPYLDGKTRTLKVRLEFPNDAGFALKPDMWVNVTLDATLGRDGLVVPIQAVIRTGERDVVLVALGEGRFEPRDVRLGVQIKDGFEVLSGLEEGEKVVLSAQFLINSESNLQAAIQKMVDAPTPTAAPAE